MFEFDVEFECTLKCNYKCPYCFNGRNEVLSEPIYESNDLEKLESLLKNNDNFYIYGGEPLLCKNINFIVKTLKENNKKYVIQSNFSIYKKIPELIEIDNNIIFQISIHRTQIRDLNKHIDIVNKYIKNITTIDVMFIDKNDLFLYKALRKKIKSENLRLMPVADFGTDKHIFRESLYMYNKLRRLKIPNVKFDIGDRSFIWEKQMRGEIVMLGKKCIGYGGLNMYDPQLNKHHCPQRYDRVICQSKTCYNFGD